MGTLQANFFISLDGVVEGPGAGDDFALAGWTGPYWSDEIGQVIGTGMMQSEAMLLGRKTYTSFKDGFANTPPAHPMHQIRKYVVSRTLHAADWGNASVISGDITAEVARLKQELRGPLIVSGSTALVHSLFDAGLVDEINLLVYPVVLGQGQRLFKDGSSAKLTLTHQQTLAHGVVHLTYAVEAPAAA